MDRRKVVMRKTGGFNLWEESAKAKLRDVWKKGHVYVELREEGKRIIYFCTLCLTKCFSDSVLDDHLRGNLHSKRRAFADSTLLVDVPFPFNDGVLFFSTNHPVKEKQLLHPRISYVNDVMSDNEVTSEFMCDSQEDPNCNNRCLALVTKDHIKSSNFVEMPGDAGNLVIVESRNDHVEPLRSNGNRLAAGNGHENSLISDTNGDYGMIHDVLLGEKLSDLAIRLMGFGCISARFCQDDEVRDEVGRIWCAWLGEFDSDHRDKLSTTPYCDFAIVNFLYTYDLGRKGTTDGLRLLASSYNDSDNTSGPRKSRKKSFSDPGETSGSFSEQGDSSCEDGPDSNGTTGEMQISKDDQFQIPRVKSNKAIRRELRRRKHLAAQKNCDICQQPMLPGKDVAALLNLKTGNLACSSRNTNGAFHAFHVSCLLHWILACELEIRSSKVTKTKKSRGRKRKSALEEQISSILCPECQGTGIEIKGDQLENPTIPLSEIFRCKLRAIQGHQAWMKDPEMLRKSSTGLRFSPQLPLQEKALPIKVLHFYRVE